MTEEILYRGFGVYFLSEKIAILEEIRSGKGVYSILFPFANMSPKNEI